ncbi:hypothetical protein [Shimia aestuarii]|uniref:Uncharacterized protein n=1 Tax=Shimia aestuarii TaxID=254406 RepID=A0A1I4I2S6_9RHOB|nr:hypothetical protein [Shimia aestuarii]SFL48213.1 hypothetical protein SAMN04488042_101375 [Shimia aestuarii]
MKYVILPLVFVASALRADPPVVENAIALQTDTGWTFDVTLSHPDTGWGHYADGWRVESMDGVVLGYRELYHPHVSEQPFTRSLTRVSLPSGTGAVAIRARCNKDGWADATYLLKLD